MKRSLYNEWTAALRGGEYEQGKGLLRDQADTYCCLGVLANLVDPNGWRQQGVRLMGCYAWDSPTEFFDPHGHWTGRLPPSVVPNSLQNELIDMNDRGQVFPLIADTIDEWAASGALPLED